MLIVVQNDTCKRETAYYHDFIPFINNIYLGILRKINI